LEKEKLNFLEASFLSIIVTISHIILNLPNTILENTGSSAVINVIYVTILALIMFVVVKKLLSPFGSNNILFVADYLGGSILRKILATLYTLHFIFISAILLRNIAETLTVIYYNQAVVWTIIALFLIVACIVNKYGSHNVIKANTLVMPLVLITIVVIFISSLDKFEISRVFPIMGFGFNNTFISGASNIYIYSGLIYIYLIRPSLKNYKDFGKVGYTSILISGIYIVLSVAGLLMLFPFLTSGNEALSAYLSTRSVEYGQFMQRTDAIFMFVWIFAFLSYLSVIILYIIRINKDSFGLKQENIFMYLVAIAIFIIALLPQNTTQIYFLQTTVYKYSSLGIVFLLSMIILFLGYFKKKKELRKGQL